MTDRYRHEKLTLFCWLILVPLILIRCDKPQPVIILPPIAAASVTPGTGLTTTVFSLDGSPSQPGNPKDEMYFRWDWNSDGQWDTKYSSEPIFTHRFYSPGNHKLFLEVLNSSGLTDTSHINITINPGFSAPRAKFSSNPPSGNRLTNFIFDASPTKDDEDSLNQLLFRWDWEGDERWDTGFKSDYLVMHNYSEVGSYRPAIEVKDPAGLISRYQTGIEVNQTNPRLFAFFNWSPLNPLQLETVTLDASLSKDLDHSDHKLVYYWNVNDESPDSPPRLKLDEWFGPFETPMFTFSFLGETGYSVTLRIVDPDGLENSINREIRVFHLNRPPTPILIVSTKLGNLTTEFFLDGRNTADLEDLYSDLKFRWDFEGDGQWDSEYQSDRTLFYRYNTPGVHKIVMEAIDKGGLTDTTSVWVKVTSGTNETGLVIDRRNDYTEYYPTVKIGEQWWMAKNMNYEPLRSNPKVDTLLTMCYNDTITNCMKWGGLYSAYYATLLDLSEGAQGICPNGWHIPTKGEWETLISTLGSNSAVEDLLLGGSSDFNAILAGIAERKFLRIKDGRPEYEWKFRGLSSVTYFWSSTPLRTPQATSHWSFTLIKGTSEVSTGYDIRANFYSVRCIKNKT